MVENIRKRISQKDVLVLDVDPVLRRRHEPAACGGPLVDLRVVEQGRRVGDVADRLERLLGGGAGIGLDPVGAQILVAADWYSQVGAAEETGHDLSRRVARLQHPQYSLSSSNHL
jgi:hypothetical protein